MAKQSIITIEMITGYSALPLLLLPFVSHSGHFSFFAMSQMRIRRQGRLKWIFIYLSFLFTLIYSFYWLTGIISTESQFQNEILQHKNFVDWPDYVPDIERVIQSRTDYSYSRCGDLQRRGLWNRTTVNTRQSFKFLYVDEHNKLVFCLIPKVASTSWKKVLLFLSSPELNFTSPNAIPNDLVLNNPQNISNWSNFRPLLQYNKDEALAILQTYTKIIWVRDVSY